MEDEGGNIAGFHGKLRGVRNKKIPFESQSIELACPLCWGRKVNKTLGPTLEELLGALGRRSHKQIAKIEACAGELGVTHSA